MCCTLGIQGGARQFLHNVNVKDLQNWRATLIFFMQLCSKSFKIVKFEENLAVFF